MKKVSSLYPLPIRIWHWVNALLFVGLAVTGIELRAPGFSLFSQYGTATAVHKYAGFSFIISFLFWLIWGIVTGAMRYYFPRGRDFKEIPHQAAFYLYSIFKGAPNPFSASEREKFNVLQKISYGAVMLILVPAIAITGIMLSDILYFFRSINAIGGLRILDALHVAAAYLLLIFLVVHIYMATLGKTITAYLKNIITGK
ncbi:MAG TPA: cytochrome b/b6 domain-containing protein [Syntrophorhabdaceae bacterium]|nr:cytochrome b/b6 domain-containing protein [Syntrophorhabdaceae bacterium]